MTTLDSDTLERFEKEIANGTIFMRDLPDEAQIVNMSANFGQYCPDELGVLSDSMESANLSYTVDALGVSNNQSDGLYTYYCVYTTFDVNPPTTTAYNDPSNRGWFLTDVDIVGEPLAPNIAVNPGTSAPGTPIGSIDTSTSEGISFGPGIGVLGEDANVIPDVSYSWNHEITRTISDVQITFQDEAPNVHWHFALVNAPQKTDNGSELTGMTPESTTTLPLQLFWVWRCPYAEMPSGGLGFNLNVQLRYAARFMRQVGGLPFTGNETNDFNVTFQYNFPLPTLQFPGNPPAPPS